MRLLIKRGDWDTVKYVSQLQRDTHIDLYFRGYKKHPDDDGSMIWDFDLARKNAGLDKKKKYGSSKEEKKKNSNKKRKK